MQAVETARGQESGYRISAAFDQNAAKAPFFQRASDCGGGELAAIVLERQDLDTRQDRRFLATRGNHDAAYAVVPQHACRRVQPSLWINDDADWVWSPYAAHGQLWIIGNRRCSANDDCVDQRPEPVEMIEAGFAIDVMGVAARRGNSPVDGLPALPDQNNVIDHTLAQRAEQVFPRLRQGSFRLTKYFRDSGPGA